MSELPDAGASALPPGWDPNAERAATVAPGIDSLMTMAANADEGGNTMLAQKFRADALTEANRLGGEYDTTEMNASANLTARLETATAQLEDFALDPSRTDIGLASGREDDPVSMQVRDTLYQVLGVTEARKTSEVVPNHTVTRTKPAGPGRGPSQYEETGDAHLLSSPLGTVVELWGKDVNNNGDYFSISIQREPPVPEGEQLAAAAT